jgi:CRP/FNR family transcriptional regulator, anaerobic regulatory protein
MPPLDGEVLDLATVRRSCDTCALRRMCLPAEAVGEQLHRIDKMVENHRPLGAGQTLFRNGEALRCLYLVRSGSLKSVAEHEDGTWQVLDFHLPGELVGLDGIAENRHTCTVEALQRTRVCAVPWTALQELARQIPALQNQLLRAIGRRSDEAHRHLEMMGWNPAIRRLPMFLRDLSARQARLQLDPALLHLPMSREDVASYLGLAEETVSRLFSRLHAEQVLSVRRKAVQIVDREALEALCAGVSIGPRPRRSAA